MKFPMPRLGFSLLGKELLEQSARKRTYAIRVLYALILFIAFASHVFHEVARSEWGGNQFTHISMMGVGKEMFEFVVYTQFAGIFLFLPAMMAGVIASEKERDSLGLLLLTELRPREILLGKYLGRLIPMFTFLLLSMPLMAIAYAWGGVDHDKIASGIWLLFWCCLQVGAIALMCSAYCRTTVAAIVSSYIVGGLFYFSVAILATIVMVLTNNRHVSWASDDTVIMYLPPYVFEDAGPQGFKAVVIRSVPIMFSTLLFLVMARVYLVRRAFVPAQQRLRKTFRWLDARFIALNKMVGNRMLSRDQDDLPVTDPVAWRELSRRSLGQPHHLIRITLAIMTLMAIVLTMILHKGSYRWSDTMPGVMFVAWSLAVMLVAVVSVNAIASERANQTLQVLLTTPIGGREIVRQKMRGVRRLTMVMAVPLLAWASAKCFIDQPFDADWLLHFVASVSTISIYLPMTAWLGMLIGLKIKSRNRAILTVLGVIIAWCAGWIVALVIVDQWMNIPHEPLLILSPAVMVILSQYKEIDELQLGEWPAVLLNSAIYVAMYLAFRFGCLRYADKWMGRASS